MIWSEGFKKLLPKKWIKLVEDYSASKDFVCYIKSHVGDYNVPDFEYQGTAKNKAQFCLYVCSKFDLDFRTVFLNTVQLPK